jgi:hypothetical protein
MKSLLVSEIQFHLSNRAQKAKVRSVLRFIKRLNKSLKGISVISLSITWNNKCGFYKITPVFNSELNTASDIVFYPENITWSEVKKIKEEILLLVQ